MPNFGLFSGTAPTPFQALNNYKNELAAFQEFFTEEHAQLQGPKPVLYKGSDKPSVRDRDTIMNGGYTPKAVAAEPKAGEEKAADVVKADEKEAVVSTVVNMKREAKKTVEDIITAAIRSTQARCNQFEGRARAIEAALDRAAHFDAQLNSLCMINPQLLNKVEAEALGSYMWNIFNASNACKKFAAHQFDVLCLQAAGVTARLQNMIQEVKSLGPINRTQMAALDVVMDSFKRDLAFAGQVIKHYSPASERADQEVVETPRMAMR